MHETLAIYQDTYCIVYEFNEVETGDQIRSSKNYGQRSDGNPNFTSKKPHCRERFIGGGGGDNRK